MSELVWILVGALIASAILTWATRGLAARLAFLDRPGLEAHKRQPHAVPYGGGLAMAIALALALAASALFWPLGESQGGSFLPILLGAVALLGVGLWDDWRRLAALPKLACQLAVIVTVVITADLHVDLLRPWLLLSVIAAVGWCVLVTNAYNLLDHADGLSASVATVSAVVLLSASLMAGDWGLARLWVGLIGVLLGFLVWNVPPARIYMGDAGALPLGLLLGCGSLSVTFWPSGSGEASPLAVLAPLLITALPLYDTAVVVVKRLRRHRPLMHGDHNHLHHRLHRLGLSPRASLGATIGLQTALAAGALQLRFSDWSAGVIVLLQAGGILMAACLLEANRDHGEEHPT